MVKFSVKVFWRLLARYSLQKLLIPKDHSLLVAKFTCYSLQKLLFAKIHSLLVTKLARNSLLLVTRCKKSLVTRCKICCYSQMARYPINGAKLTKTFSFPRPFLHISEISSSKFSWQFNLTLNNFHCYLLVNDIC